MSGDDDDDWLPLRLRVLRSRILRKNATVAVLDAYGEIQIGRDALPVGSETPRIRLKEMEVSKLHATVFWDKARGEWAVVDMGSKHGTFVRTGQDPPVRLSPGRTASIPRRLQHLDELIIGSTVFLCHIHADRTPCGDCTLTGEGAIPLFAVPQEGARAGEGRRWEERRDAKRALTSLRRTLLARLPASTSTYVDRSAGGRGRDGERRAATTRVDAGHAARPGDGVPRAGSGRDRHVHT